MGKMRSPNYPAIGLSKALELIKRIYDKEKRTPVQPEALVKALGFDAMSGPARTALSALRKFGLLDEDSKGIKLSDLALRILLNNPASEERAKALQEAAGLPDLFREFYESHPDASDDALKSHLLLKLKFSEKGAKNFISAFRDTLLVANPNVISYDPSMKPANTSKKTDIFTGFQPSPQKSQQIFSWPLSKEVSAEVRFTGPAITPEHLERLREYLALAKNALGIPDEEGSE